MTVDEIKDRARRAVAEMQCEWPTPTHREHAEAVVAEAISGALLIHASGLVERYDEIAREVG